MKKPVDINKKVEETLGSLDNIQRAEPQSFFFTRVNARLKRDEKSFWETTGAFLARPAVAIAGLFVILVLNVFILIQKETSTSPALVSETYQPQEDENIFAAVNTYDYENLEP
ncbi:MAG TPA: hypothetical protein VFI06_14900 [Chitinophagaceae bacterium]|nr:hypothetical protein [Chitinophagaceae bacterium]